jgi:hypothetical protein
MTYFPVGLSAVKEKNSLLSEKQESLDEIVRKWSALETTLQ